MLSFVKSNHVYRKIKHENRISKHVYRKIKHVYRKSIRNAKVYEVNQSCIEKLKSDK